MAYRVTAAARTDLLCIGRFTQRRWGVAQRRSYLARLHAAIERISAHPQIGLACPQIRQGYLQWVEGRHVIFYRVGDDNAVEIIRILHQSMSPSNLLMIRDMD